MHQYGCRDYYMHSLAHHIAHHTGECRPKGKALILAPYQREFSANGGDESDQIAAILRDFGYSVTYKCDDPSICTGGQPGLEDFKNWGQYATVVLVSHGDSDRDGSNPVVFTGVNYASVMRAAQPDLDAGLLEFVADGTLALTPEWFGTYANQFAGAVIYMSACR